MVTVAGVQNQRGKLRTGNLYRISLNASRYPRHDTTYDGVPHKSFVRRVSRSPTQVAHETHQKHERRKGKFSCHSCVSWATLSTCNRGIERLSEPGRSRTRQPRRRYMSCPRRDAVQHNDNHQDRWIPPSIRAGQAVHPRQNAVGTSHRCRGGTRERPLEIRDLRRMFLVTAVVAAYFGKTQIQPQITLLWRHMCGQIGRPGTF